MESTSDRGKKRIWKRWWFWVGVTPLALALLTFVAAERTSQSTFCITCHYMQPFYDSWKTSSHKDVECIKCHFPPSLQGTVRGKLQGLYQVVSYVSNMYKRSRPWAEIEDASCLRSGCHKMDIMADTTVVMFRGVKFKHAVHLHHQRRGAKLRCTSCHSQIVQGKHMVVTPSTCMLCHMRAGGVLSPSEVKRGVNGCLICHIKPGGEHASTHPRLEGLSVKCSQCHGRMIAGDGTVERERCFSCHWDQKRLAEYSDTNLIHRVHITEHKIECLNCHSLIQHKTVLAESAERLDCQGCHPKLHEPQHTLFTGVGAHDVPPMPNPMFARGIQCQSCHIYHQKVEFPELGHDIRASANVCEQCHGRGFARLLDMWNTTTRRKTETLRRMEADIRSRNRRHPDSLVTAALDSADYNLTIVTQGHPVHNIVYATAILDTSYELLKRAAETFDPPVRLPKFQAGEEGAIPTKCSACHVTLMSQRVMAFGKIPYSHEIHVAQQHFDCMMCHSNTRKHGERIIQPSGCADCHHRPDNKARCGACHTAQKSLFVGSSVLFGNKPDPLSNIHAEQPCRGCHGGVGNPVAKANTASCDNCHEPGYGDMLVSWQEDTHQSVAEVQEALAAVDQTRLTARQIKRYRLAVQAVEAIVADKSWGVHNADRVETILDRAGSIAEELPKQPNP